MKILATCETCDQDFLLDQLLEGPVITGQCPWCETVLAPNYTELLLEYVRTAEEAGCEFVSALKVLTGSWARFRIHPQSVLDPVREALGPEDDGGTRRSRLADDIRRALGLVDQWSSDGEMAAGEIDAARAALESVERGLRDRASGSGDGTAMEEMAATIDSIAASAERDGREGDVIRGKADRIRAATDRDPESGLDQAAAEVALARKEAEGVPVGETDRLRDALENLRRALQGAMEALSTVQ